MTTDTGSPGTGGNPGGQPAGQDGGNWAAGIAPDLAPVVQAKGWKTAGDAVKSYVELEKMIGQNRIAVPGKDAKPEEWDAVWNALGRPETADKYSFKRPDNLAAYDEDFAKWFRGAAHKAGVPDRVASALHDQYVGWFAEMMAKDVAAVNAAKAEGMKALETEWGPQFEPRKAMALEAVRATRNEKLVEWFDKSGLGDDPNMIRLMAFFGEKMGESTIKGTGAGGALSPEAAKAEIAKIQGDPKHAYHDRDNPEHKLAVERMTVLHKLAYPEPAQR